MNKRQSSFAPTGHTALAHCGLQPAAFHGFVNPPVAHGSTVLFPDTAAMEPGGQRYSYARRGNPTSDALEAALCTLDGAAACRLTPSGLSAVSLACMTATKAGDHFLVSDNVYAPTRKFCDDILTSFGVQVEYFDPLIGADFPRLLRDNTSALFLEAPGSLTFEMVDVAMFARTARAADIVTIIDNTWATPLFYRPLDHGVDMVVQAATKYIVGHSDVMMGCVTANAAASADLIRVHGGFGLHVAPDDVFLALRGLRTLRVRLERHMQSALHIADWLSNHELVARVMYPALPGDPGHALWRRDFKGASGLFAFQLAPSFDASAGDAFLDALQLFGLGYSWGGFESLASRAKLSDIRDHRPADEGPILRLHIGLEEVADLMADLEQGFAALRAARP